MKRRKIKGFNMTDKQYFHLLYLVSVKASSLDVHRYLKNIYTNKMGASIIDIYDSIYIINRIEYYLTLG